MSKRDGLPELVSQIRACRVCIEAPARGRPLPHEPRPVLQVSSGARIGIFGQAPGVRVHESGRPFTDPSGDRLRAWLGVDEKVFYDEGVFAIIPMGFCFPGLDAKGGDLPPRKECARTWRTELMKRLSGLDLSILVGKYAIDWHLGQAAHGNLTDTVAAWRNFAPAAFPVPHPSWRNNVWLKRNPWFEEDLLPSLQKRVRELL